ncbi:hypothetical protein LJC64_02415 [Ruminococcaceae bacterium OttesenSCG-928-A11]|nr:hypothetical protein [Ruminococcaceae bacterium OttesenSCG-928-A11]
MDIRLYDVATSACKFANDMLMNGNLSETRAAKNTIAFSEENRTYVANLMIGAIAEYHSALRRNLQKQGIDIGDFMEVSDEDDA